MDSRTSNMTEDGERVVISGVSGIFPGAQSVKELSEILYNKINPLKPAENRWVFDHPEGPKYLGQISGQGSFDAHFFKVNHRLCSHMDTMTRKVLENTYMALFDAGINPEYFNEKYVGVYVASSIAESDNANNYDTKSVTGLGLLGTAKCMSANRISYWLGARGPSTHIEAGSASSMVALSQAYHGIIHGHFEAAIVATSQVNLHPQTVICSGREVKLSMDDRTRSFDQNASGSIYSDAITVFVLQKAKDAFRIYAEIAQVKCELRQFIYNYKEKNENINEILKSFLSDFYDGSEISPDVVKYVEAFGSAQSLIDKAELEAIAEVYCKNRKDPVFVGSVMSNIGNTYAASGSCSILKVLLAFYTGKIAGNLHYETPRRDVAAVHEGRLMVAADHLPCRVDYVPVTNLSYSGKIGHLLLKRRYKRKDLTRYACSIPRLVLVSGRQEECMQKIIDNLKSRPIDAEEIALLNGMQKVNMNGHLGRGFVVLDTENDTTVSLTSDMSYFDNAKRPIWFVYSGMGSQWTGMGIHLMRIPIFAAAIERCRKILEPTGVDITNIITSTDRTTFDNVIHSFVGIAAIQIGLTDVLHALNIVPDGIIGHSLGEMGCGYADGCLSADQMLLAAYSRGLVSVQTPFIVGAMAAVGMGYQKIFKILPPEIEVACHNSQDSCTISGPADKVKQFVKQLVDKKIFAKEVPCSNIAYHSRYIADAGPLFLKYLKQIIVSPKPRSSRWMSTSVPQNNWSDHEAKLSSAEYHTNNLLNPVLFEEALRLIPRNAVLVEIAPHGLLQAILKRAFPSVTLHIPLTNRNSSDNALFLLEGIGKLFMAGVNPDVGALYPKVEFPVSTSTPMLSHLVSWAYQEEWPIPLCIKPNEITAAICELVISTSDDEYRYLKGHQSRGKTVFPFSAALVAVWDTLAMSLNKKRHSTSVKFQDVHLFTQPVVSDRKRVRLQVSINKGNGLFEVLQDDIKVIVGNITELSVKEIIKAETNHENLPFRSQVVYQLLYEKGLLYTDEFQSIYSIDNNVNKAYLTWRENWVTFIDGLVQLNILKNKLPNVEPRLCFIKSMKIDLWEHRNIEQSSLIPAYVNDLKNSVRCGGVSLNNLKFINLPLENNKVKMNLGGNVGKIMNNGYTTTTGVVLKTSRLGDFNSLHWTQEPKSTGSGIEVLVKYAGINAHDVKCAEGQILTEKEELLSDRCYGIDFSGVTSSGVQVMGLVENGSVKTKVRADSDLLWPVPPHWSLEDAATVPLAYSLAFYCLIIQNNLKPGMTVLVHGGAGALGLAVISIALAYDVDVLTTVSSIRKKRFLKNIFPKLKEDNIGNSRQITFEDMVLTRTKGLGCDIIINCGKGLIKNSSMKCCSSYGISLDTSPAARCEHDAIGMNALMRSRSYATVDITSIFKSENITQRKQLQLLISEGIAQGYVRPLTRVIYSSENVADAFSLVAASQHQGRVLLDLRTLSPQTFIEPRIECNPALWSAILFDDDVMSMKLAERLVTRGARKLRLYAVHHTQSYFLYTVFQLRSKFNDIQIKISETIDEFVNETGDGPTEGFYVILNTTESAEKISFTLKQVQLVLDIHLSNVKYKALISDNCKISRQICKFTEDNNLQAIVITLSKLKMKKNQSYKASMTSNINIIEEVLANTEGNSGSLIIESESTDNESIFKQISTITGLAFPENINNDKTLSQIGLDRSKSKAVSAMLWDAYNTLISEENIANLTIRWLNELDDFKTYNDTAGGLDCLIAYTVADMLLADTSPICMPTLTNNVDPTETEFDDKKTYLIIVPGLESLYVRFLKLCESLKIAALVLQPRLDKNKNTIREQAEEYYDELKQIIKHDTFYILGYECGVPIAMQLASIFEDHGKKGTVFCLGHGPDELRLELEAIAAEVCTDTSIEVALVRHVIKLITGKEICGLKQVLNLNTDWKKQLHPYINAHLKHMDCVHKIKYIILVIEGILHRYAEARKPFSLAEPLNSRVILLRSLPRRSLENAASDTDTSITTHPYSREPVIVYELGTPLEISVKDPKCTSIINRHLDTRILDEYNNKNLCQTYPSSDLIKFV